MNHKDFFKITVLNDEAFNDNPNIDLSKLYEMSCKEMALQQSKRDTIINVYMLIFSFMVPFVFSLENIEILEKGLIFSVLGFLGIIFSTIAVRYRVYKEAYWITCATITQMGNLKSTMYTKEIVQSLYYKCMYKKWCKYIKVNKKSISSFNKWKIFTKNIFSAETLYYLVISLITVITLSIGIYTTLSVWVSNPLLISLIIVVCVFIWLIWMYYYNLTKIYSVLIDKKESSFNFAFSKAWFLHFYK